MNTRDLAIAIAVAGAKHPDGSFVLGERARRVGCDGRTWLPAFLQEPEACPGPTRTNNVMSSEVDQRVSKQFWHAKDCTGGCGGSGRIQRVDEGLLRTLMEEAGYTVNYIAKEWSVAKDWENVREFRESRAYGQAPTLLEACAAALGVGA